MASGYNRARVNREPRSTHSEMSEGTRHAVALATCPLSASGGPAGAATHG